MDISNAFSNIRKNPKALALFAGVGGILGVVTLINRRNSDGGNVNFGGNVSPENFAGFSSLEKRFNELAETTLKSVDDLNNQNKQAIEEVEERQNVFQRAIGDILSVFQRDTAKAIEENTQSIYGAIDSVVNQSNQQYMNLERGLANQVANVNMGFQDTLTRYLSNLVTAQFGYTQTPQPTPITPYEQIAQIAPVGGYTNPNLGFGGGTGTGTYTYRPAVIPVLQLPKQTTPTIKANPITIPGAIGQPVAKSPVSPIGKSPVATSPIRGSGGVIGYK